MKRIEISGLKVVLDVSDNFDIKEIQERLYMINYYLGEHGTEVSTGRISGINKIDAGSVKVKVTTRNDQISNSQTI